MNFLRSSILCGTAALAFPYSSSFAGVSMVPLTGFAGDGWLAPGEGGYTYLGTGTQERGIAYNAATDHLVLVSRNGNSVRLLDASNGEDAGELPNPNGYSGGFFPVNMAGVGDDGAIYVANLQTNISTGVVKVYRWENQAAPAPTEYFNGTIGGLTGTFRTGDSFDVTGAGLDTKMVLGFSGGTGYLVIAAVAGPAAGDPPVGEATAVTAFTGAGTGISAGDFRLGITFGKDGANHVWGRQSSNSTGRRTTYTGVTGTNEGPLPLSANTEVAMDFALIGGRPLLATLETNGTTSPVRVYDVTDPASPAIAATGTTATGALTANSNGVGSIKWGKITTGAAGTTATLYALAANRGLQAFTVTVTAEITPPAIVTPPDSRSVFERGVAVFRVAASGTPPLSYQWLKDGVEIPLATSATLTVSPVMVASAGDYTCRVSNAAAPPALSAAATLTVVPSVNTGALTECWQLSPGSRDYLTEGDTQRGLGYNPSKNRLYLATRSPAALVKLLNAADGADLGTLDMTGVTGGTFAINMTGVAGDGFIYACNLSNTGTGAGFKIYQWPDDLPGTAPATVYDSNPINSRIGDSFTVRGAGPATECAAGAANTNQFVIFKPDGNGFLTAYPVTATDAANEAFALGIAFGQGNIVWGKDNGGNLTAASYEVDAATGLPTGAGALIAAYPGSNVPAGGGAIAVDNTNGCLAHIHVGDSDNVRLYRLPNPAPAALELLDQEFFDTDNTNANGTGSLVFGGDKLFALDTNNGLVCYTVVKPAPTAAPPIITEVTRTGSDVVFKLKGTMGKTYLIERSPELTPLASWTSTGTVTQTAVEVTVTRAIEAGTPRLYWRAREQ